MSTAATLLVLYWLVIAIGFPLADHAEDDFIGDGWIMSVLWPIGALLFALGQIRDFVRARFWGRS